MADVFISYSKQDVTDARMLAALLEANGYTVWWDNSLIGGEQFRGKIASELAAARAVVVIWTKTSVASDWVQSEAGRALGDQKLVPVRSSEIEYNEIPPPFENRHTLKLNQTEQILAAIAAQLAKPVSAGPWRKALRRELLLWIGVFGGAVTLLTNISGIIKLSNAATWLLSNWGALLKQFWHALLLFKVEIAAVDAELLTMSLLMTSAVLYSSFRPPTVGVRKSPILYLFFPLLFMLLLLIAGSFTAEKRESDEYDQRYAARQKSLVEGLFTGNPECMIIAKKRWGVDQPAPRPRLRINGMPVPELPQETAAQEAEELATRPAYDACIKWAEGKPELTAPFGVSRPDSMAQTISSLFLSLDRDLRGDTDFGTPIMQVLVIISPLLLPFVLYWILSFVLPLKLQVATLSRRLWRTLFVFVGLIAMNYVAVGFEIANRWLAAISG